MTKLSISADTDTETYPDADTYPNADCDANTDIRYRRSCEDR